MDAVVVGHEQVLEGLPVPRARSVAQCPVFTLAAVRLAFDQERLRLRAGDAVHVEDALFRGEGRESVVGDGSVG